MLPQTMSEAEMLTWFETVYRANYPSMLRYAQTLLRSLGSGQGTLDGRAEEAVQEMFLFAWEHRERLAASPSPTGWLYRVLGYKVRELLHEDRQWTKRLLRMSEIIENRPGGASIQLRLELTGLISKEEHRLLSRLYVEGYTYEELAREMGLKKSALAMRVKRIKERILEEHGDEL